jgi:hypothetical protein
LRLFARRDTRRAAGAKVTLRSFGPTENVGPQDDRESDSPLDAAVAELIKQIGKK